MKKLVVFYLCGLLYAGAVYAQYAPMGTIDDRITWIILNDTLTIRGEGAIPDYSLPYFEDDPDASPWNKWCSSLNSVVICEGITSIGKFAFPYCSNTTSVVIPASAKNIGLSAFVGCISLSEIINLCEEPQEIGAGYIFPVEIVETCTLKVSEASLEAYRNDLEWRLSCTNIEPIQAKIMLNVQQMRFYGPTGTTGIGISANISGDVTNPELISWRSSDPDVATVDNNATITATGPGRAQIIASIGSIEAACTVTVFEYGNSGTPISWGILDGVLTVSGNGAIPDYTSPNDYPPITPAPWYVHKDKITSVEISNTITAVGDYAFFNLSGITSVSIPGSVNKVGTSAFAFCKELVTISIPSSITFIGDQAFNACSSLSEIINNSVTPQIFTDETVNAFAGVPYTTCTLRVPAASVNLYRKAEIWKKFEKIVALDGSLTLDKEEIYLLPGATMSMTIKGGETSNPLAVIWMSENTAVADVDPVGTITAVGPGKTKIVATDGITPVMCTVTVIEKGTSSIEGTIDITGTETVIVKIYINETLLSSLIKGKIVGGYVLLATTVPNEQGKYHFDELPEGSYQIEVLFGDFEPEATDAISLSEDTALSEINFTVDPVLGIIVGDIPTASNELFIPDLKIYPNPFTDVVHMAGVDAESGHTLTFRVRNITGATVYTQIISDPDAAVHLGHLPAGMYIIQMENGRKTTTVKVVKR